MEWKVGEIKQINDERYQCVKGTGCQGCDLQTNCKSTVICIADGIQDREEVIFKKLEKVGEPFERNGYMYQEYKAHTYSLLISGGATIPTHNGFAVIIKQTKEDMEEKKLNLKPFDIQKAREGKPVCTRDGCKARIICFDSTLKNYPLVVLVDGKAGEYPYTYTAKGKFDEDGKNSDFDLMMLPEKKSGWINIYTNTAVKNSRHCGSNIYASKEEALNNISPFLGHYINTNKIEWEE